MNAKTVGMVHHKDTQQCVSAALKRYVATFLLNYLSPLISKARNYAHLFQLATSILIKHRNRHTQGSNPNY